MDCAHKTNNCIVGKEYLVAHAKIKFDYDGHEVDIPIIPLKHSDPQFGFKGEHYHIDGRFDYKDAVQIGRYNITGGKTNNIVMTNYKDTVKLLLIGYKILSIDYLVKKCLRKVTGIIPPKDNLIYNEWYNSYLGKSCAGKKCPHFGTQMITVKGVTYCPLHGLHADKEIIVEPY